MKNMYCMFLHAEVYFARIWVCCPHYHIASQMPSVITVKIEDRLIEDRLIERPMRTEVEGNNASPPSTQTSQHNLIAIIKAYKADVHIYLVYLFTRLNLWLADFEDAEQEYLKF